MVSTVRFEKLFQPLWLGEMEVRNRIVMPAMGTNYAAEDGHVTEQLKAYYEERARGGVGLIIVEVACIDSPIGKTIRRQICIDDDKFIPGLAELVRVIQKHGAKAAIQLHHAGRIAPSRFFTGYQPVAPSPIPALGGVVPRELSLEDIHDIVAHFAKGAERARAAGFNGVEIHAAHGYLLAQFMSAASNKRRDGYGGELRNRARLLLEVVAAIKEKVGPSYPVWPRITGREFDAENGITSEESQRVARWLEEAGVAAINVSADRTRPAHAAAWVVEGEKLPLPPMAIPRGFLVPVAEAIKKSVRVPVMVVGRMNPDIGERVLQEGKADMVVMGRALIADPNLPNKAASGRLEDINPCIACLVCRECILTADAGVRCTINAAAGKEREYRIIRARQRKRVVVIGGGPAGMEAARVAALRGHEVILYDQGARLGGRLLVAAIPPHKGELAKFADYLTTQVGKLGVRVELGKQVTPELVMEARPDVVIIAAGATRHLPPITGIARAKVVSAEDVLTGKAEVGARVVVLGGGVVGCETAEFLADRGKRVTVVEMLDTWATGMEIVHREYLLDRLARLGVTLLNRTRGEEITEEGLVVSTGGGPRHTLEADTIVLASSTRPNQDLYQALQGKVPELYLIGDCKEPRRIVEAVDEGYRIALGL